MTKQCKVCNKIYNQDTQPILCPHIEFPKQCKIHKRIHCGNLECQSDYISPKLNRVEFPYQTRKEA